MSLIYEITKVPDLSLTKYQVFADSGVDGMLNAQTQFIRQLHRVAMLGNVRIHFIFCYDPQRQAGKKLRILINFTGENESYRSKLKKVISSSGISNYFSFNEISEEIDCTLRYSATAYMYKKERFLQTASGNEERYFYVVPNWKINDSARLYSLFKLMQSFDEPCCYRVDLFTEKGMEERIHSNFEKPLSFLRNLSTREGGVSEFSKIHQEKRDPNADETLHQYEDWIKAVDMSPAFICRICAFSNDTDYSQLLLNSVISESLITGDANIVAKEGTYSIIDDLDILPEYHSKEAPNSMKKWATTYTTEEVAAFVRLPVLYDGENLEIPKETAAIQYAEGMVIGQDVNGYPVTVSEEAWAKHMFICGVPGSGKTNTMLHIADSLWNGKITIDGRDQAAHIPFLVLEPAKKEYRELSLFDIPELIIFSPSACTNFPVRINPFEFPQNLTLSEHIGNLCKVFEGAFPIAPPAPFILDKAIQTIYENRGWNVKDINTGVKEYPTMSDLYAQFKVELSKTTYDTEIKGNIQSVLEMRIGSLLRREMKAIFDAETSSFPPEGWLERPVIIELESLGEGPANFLTLLLCTLVRETLKANPYKDKDKKIRHVIFIEEAHNLIASESQAKEPQDSNPKVAATAYIVKMLAEVRALREGIIIADQLPTAMAPEVIKNTNIKLVHRLTAQDDRELIGGTMSASPLQMESMATYTQGKALISYEKLQRPFEVQVCEVEQHGKVVLDDNKLFEIMKSKPLYKKFRQEEERRKFESIKQRALQAIDLEIRTCNKLKNINCKSMETQVFEKWVNSQVDLLNHLRALGIGLTYESSLLSNDFIDAESKKSLIGIVKQIGTHFDTVLKKVVETI